MRKYTKNIEILNRTENTIETNKSKYDNAESYKKMISLIDYTSLDVADTNIKIRNMVDYVNNFKTLNPSVPNIAGICTYPTFISLIKQSLSAKGVNIISVAGSFPSSQTIPKVKYLEVESCINDGANEIDIVLPVGKFLEGNYKGAFEEISFIKSLCRERKLKIILEIDALKDCNSIYNASMLAMDAGADFLKTSTGKFPRDDENFESRILIMCDAIQDFKLKEGNSVGIKPAGKIKTAAQVLRIYTLISETLGVKYQTNRVFRIGTSGLINSLLEEINSNKNA